MKNCIAQNEKSLRQMLQSRRELLRHFQIAKQYRLNHMVKEKLASVYLLQSDAKQFHGLIKIGSSIDFDRNRKPKHHKCYGETCRVHKITTPFYKEAERLFRETFRNNLFPNNIVCQKGHTHIDWFQMNARHAIVTLRHIVDWLHKTKKKSQKNKTKQKQNKLIIKASKQTNKKTNKKSSNY